MIQVVIPTFNRVQLLFNLIKDLDYQLTQLKNIKVLIVNAGIGFNLPSDLNNPGLFSIMHVSRNYYWTRSVASAVNHLKDFLQPSDFILLLNDDIILPRNFLKDCQSNLPLKNEIYSSFVTTIRNIEENIKDTMLINKFNVKKRNFYKVQIIKSDIIFKKNKFPLLFVTGRGTVIPYSLFLKGLNLNWIRFPHYLGDYNLSINSQKINVKLYLHEKLNVYSFDDYGADKLEQNILKKYFSINSPSFLPSHLFFIFKHSNFLRKNEN